MLEKRGQITIFIIIGIILLASTAVIIYLKQAKPAVEEPEVPEHMAPVVNYVEQCIETYVKQGVLLMGAQGGYIYLPERIAANPFSHIEPISGSPIKVPYWYYKDTPLWPEIEDMERDLQDYVRINMPECLNNFSSFPEFNINRTGEISAKATIAKNAVIVTLTMPLEINTKGRLDLVKKSTFDGAIPVKLRKVHELAKDIIMSENENLFLEDLTIDLMTLGPNIPFSDIDFECRQKIWHVSSVERDIKNLLYYNLPRIRFEDAEHEGFLAPMSVYENLRGIDPGDYKPFGNKDWPTDVPSDAYDYFHFFWDISDKDYSDLKASIYYLKDWNFDLTVKPSDGRVMKASYGKGMEKYLRFLCLNVYHFTYTLTYPVEIVIRDDSSFETGYVFRFAIPVQIKNNQGDRSDFGESIYQTPEQGEDFCEQRGDKEMRIYAKDKTTFNDIKDVNITFSCMGTFFCDLGKTAKDVNVYRLRTTLPSFCSPGTLEAEKEHYLKSSVSVPTDKTSVDIFMTPLKAMDFEVVKRKFSADTFSPAEYLEPGEKAVIYLSYPNESDYYYYRQYPFTPEMEEELETIELIEDDVTYDLDIVLISKDNEFIGGYRGNWTVTYNDLISSNAIIFQAMEKIPHPENEDEQAELSLLMENENYTIELKPLLR